jgi:putative transposase
MGTGTFNFLLYIRGIVGGLRSVQVAAMPRTRRIAPGGWVFHVLNRRNGRDRLFETDRCYREFLWILQQAAVEDGMRILAYCAMPTHWHLVLWPQADGDLGRFVHRVALRHAARWQRRHRCIGRGHLYQARYKSFPVCTDEYLLTVCRYVERNPLRAGFVERAEDWPWSSLRSRSSGFDRLPKDESRVRLAVPPVQVPADWVRWVNQPQTDAELTALRACVSGGHPYGGAGWREEAAASLGLCAQPSSRGRPNKRAPAAESAPRENTSLF